MTTTIYTLRRYQVDDGDTARSVYTVSTTGRRLTLQTIQQAAAWVRRLVH